MKRTKPLRRGKPLRSRSKKTEARYAGASGRRALVVRLLRERRFCELGPVLRSAHFITEILPQPAAFWRVVDRAARRCSRKATQVHEVLARSAGGDILDEANCKATCAACHRFVGDHPRAATILGFRRSRYARGAA